MTDTYDWFNCTPCNQSFPSYDHRNFLDKLLNMYGGPIAYCPECGEMLVSHSSFTLGDEPTGWEHGEG